MTYVIEMSTNDDIRTTQLDAGWSPIETRCPWAYVNGMNLNILDGARIVVIAHGNGNEIGNANPGVIDINAIIFLALIQGNMAANSAPAAIYISTCGPGISEFAANVHAAAGDDQMWGTRIFGHNDPVAGPVPPPNDIRWFEIF